MKEDVRALCSRLTGEGRSRFPNWDAAMWESVLEGPAARLALSMESAGSGAEEILAALDAYLSLAREAVGLGYLYPPSAGRKNFFSLAWMELLPRGLPSLSRERRAEVLAACWNLGENLEKSEPWIMAAFMHVAGGAITLDSLEKAVDEASKSLLQPPERELDPGRARMHWVHLGGADPLFLPGKIGFVAPCVVTVFDRSADLDGKPRSAQTVWLSDPPVILGRAGAKGWTGAAGDTLDQAMKDAFRADPRFTDFYGATINKWRAAATMVTSQFLVAAIPG